MHIGIQKPETTKLRNLHVLLVRLEQFKQVKQIAGFDP